ncbi:MAG: hypothetical protein AB7V50_02070 [Vampirovibrionia bacterium]
MTVICSNNLSFQVQNKNNSQNLSASNLKNESNVASSSAGQSGGLGLIDSIEALDARIAELGEQSTKTQKGAFAKCYNVFSKKDDRMNTELQQLKDTRTKALEDGSINKNEFSSINDQVQKSEQSLSDYKKGKKSAAETTATVGAIAAGVAVGVATGGAGLAVVAGVSAAASGLSYVGVKEACLGDEYKALGKEGFRDGAIAAAYGASGGVLGAAGKAVAPAIANGASKAGMAVSEKVAEAAVRCTSKVCVDESVMVANKAASGEGVTFVDAAVTAGASMLFGSGGDAMASKEITKKIGSRILEKTTKETATSIAESKTKYFLGV